MEILRTQTPGSALLITQRKPTLETIKNRIARYAKNSPGLWLQALLRGPHVPRPDLSARGRALCATLSIRLIHRAGLPRLALMTFQTFQHARLYLDLRSSNSSVRTHLCTRAPHVFAPGRGPGAHGWIASGDRGAGVVEVVDGYLVELLAGADSIGWGWPAELDLANAGPSPGAPNRLKGFQGEGSRLPRLSGRETLTSKR